MQFSKKLKLTLQKGLLFVTPYFLLYFPAVAQQEQTIDFLRPDRANIIDSQRIGWGGQHSAGLHKCLVKGDAILRWFVITNLESGMGHDYDNGAIIGSYARLVDNFYIEHKLLRSYYINGRGQEQQNVNLRTNDSIWAVAEFENGSKDITNAWIISDGIQFNAPVE